LCHLFGVSFAFLAGLLWPWHCCVFFSLKIFGVETTTMLLKIIIHIHTLTLPKPESERWRREPHVLCQNNYVGL